MSILETGRPAGAGSAKGMTRKEYDEAVRKELREIYVEQGAPHFPTWRYKARDENDESPQAVLVKNAAELEERKLTEANGWARLPARARELAAGNGAQPDPEDAPNPQDEYYQFNQPQVLEAIALAKQALQVQMLRTMREKEVAHPKKTLQGGRAKVLQAIDEALMELERVRKTEG